MVSYEGKIQCYLLINLNLLHGTPLVTSLVTGFYFYHCYFQWTIFPKYICTSIKKDRRKLTFNVLKCLMDQEGAYIYSKNEVIKYLFLSFLIRLKKWTHKTELCFKPKSKYKSNKRQLEMCFANRLFSLCVQMCVPLHRKHCQNTWIILIMLGGNCKTKHKILTIKYIN